MFNNYSNHVHVHVGDVLGIFFVGYVIVIPFSLIEVAFVIEIWYVYQVDGKEG